MTDQPWMAVCKMCRFREVWNTQDAATVASLCHVSEAHPETYFWLVGSTELPADTGRPEEYGDRLA